MALVAALIPVLGLGAPASAEAPPTAVAEFNAPLCDGSTGTDPRNATPAPYPGWSDLTLVSGDRLDAYNAGKVVPLYDNSGRADSGGAPPLCATFYDPDTSGPVSVWMFCTDVEKHTCGEVGPDGELYDAHAPSGSEDVGQMEDLPGNPDLSAEDERLIAYLLRNGYDNFTPVSYFSGDPGYDNGADRWALQGLIWCISDPGYAWSDLEDLCDQNLSAADRAEILAKIPPSAEISVDLDSGVDHVVVGRGATVTLKTNVFEQPIRLSTSGPVDIDVCAASAAEADLSGNEVVVHGTDPTTTKVVELCLTPTATGPVTLTAGADAVSSEYLQWGVADGNCQVFARFEDTAPARTEDELLMTVLPAATAPAILTRSSTAIASPGAALFDTVSISGFTPGYGARGSATLYGPFAKASQAVCSSRTAVATVRFTPISGVVRTPTVRVRKTGYYTWVARTTADSRNLAATHACGLKQETTLVRKRPYVAPRVDTGFGMRADGQMWQRRLPSTITIRSAGVRAPITKVGLSKHRMMIPADTSRVGQLTRSAGVGDLIGSTVIAGHVSDRHDAPGAFWRLRTMKRGKIITVTEGGKTLRYKVTRVQRFDRDKKMPQRLFSTVGAHKLVLISCANKVTYRSGAWHYTQNVVVIARPLKR